MAYSFDGTNDKITFSDLAALDGAAALSGCMWYKPDATSQLGLLFGKMADISGATGGTKFVHGLTAGTAGDDLWFAIDVTGGNVKFARADDVFTGTGWFHVGFIYDGSAAAADRIKVVVNGVNQTVTLPNGNPGATTVTNAQAITLGATTADTADLPGDLAHFKLWTAVLTVAEMLQEMNSYRPVRKSDLLIWCPMDDTTVSDYSGSGNTASAIAGATLVAGPPVNYGG